MQEQVNVGCNYNRPKVAKFLVTLIVTRMKDLMIQPIFYRHIQDKH